MMRKIILTAAAILMVAVNAQAQDKTLMNNYQKELQGLFAEVYDAPTDGQRYRANQQAVALLAEALEANNSFRWQWDFGGRVSVLTSQDKKFRIFTWPVVNDEGEYECFGIVQALNERTNQYEVHLLVDQSELIVNRQEEVLSCERWLGAVYQELITTSHEGRYYYTLLGWNGVDNITQRKVIEPICFKSGGSVPTFGQNLFRKESNLRRVVLEYNKKAMVSLHYEEQYIHKVERIRAKRKASSQPRYKPQRRGRKGKGRPRGGRPVATAARTASAQQEKVRTAPTEKVTDEKQKMIIFDEVAPQTPGMEGLYQYYVPSGVEKAYIFSEGKWQLNESAQGRVKNKRLNQDFDKPLKKKAPAYIFGKQP